MPHQTLASFNPMELVISNAPADSAEAGKIHAALFVRELEGGAREIADFGRRDRLDTGPNGHSER